MQYFLNNFDEILGLTKTHIRLSLIPVVLALIIAIPLGVIIHRLPPVRRVMSVVASVIFTVPSLALFVTLPVILKTQVLDESNVIVALTLYSASLLVRAVPEALDAVPGEVKQAAEAVGYKKLRRVVRVELPLALPVLIASLRVVTVTNISMVAVGSVIGFGGLGQLFTRGYQRDYPEQIVTGIVIIVLVALVLDAVLVLIGRLLTPWTHPSQRRSARALARLTAKGQA